MFFTVVLALLAFLAAAGTALFTRHAWRNARVADVCKRIGPP
jgi:hypothetical protein